LTGQHHLLYLLRPPLGENMARSLVVKHEEKLGTSPLLTAFLVLSAIWMVGGVFLSSLAGGSSITTSVVAE
jgi:hypothetical protein